MKKIICIVICIAFLAVLTSCGPKLPEGEASRINFTDGWEIGESTFEYVNESTVKIVRTSDGQVFYVPNNNIDMIFVK
jgi:hypothetical protein